MPLPGLARSARASPERTSASSWASSPPGCSRTRIPAAAIACAASSRSAASRLRSTCGKSMRLMCGVHATSVTPAASSRRAWAIVYAIAGAPSSRPGSRWQCRSTYDHPLPRYDASLRASYVAPAGYDRRMPDRLPLHRVRRRQRADRVATRWPCWSASCSTSRSPSRRPSPGRSRSRSGSARSTPRRSRRPTSSPIFRERRRSTASPATWPSACTTLAVHVRDTYDGDAARVWTDAADARRAARQPRRPPGLRRDEDQGARRRAGQALRRRGRAGLVPWHPTLGDVDSAQALADYQAAKRVHKAEWSKAPA